MLKMVDFLCLWVLKLLLLVLLLPKGAQIATNVAAGVTGKSLHCYISANQHSRFQTSSPPFFLSLLLTQKHEVKDSWSCRLKIKKKQKFRRPPLLQNNIALPAIAAKQHHHEL
jgi:hypothetical protein